MALCRWSAACRCAPQEFGDDHEIVRQHGGADQQFETLATFDERALHAAASEQHGDATFDTRAEALPLLERGTFLECFPLGVAPATSLRDTREHHARRLARRDICVVEEAPIRTIQIGRMTKGLGVAIERRRDVELVGRVAREHAVLRNQPAATFGEEHLVAELNGLQHLAPFDQIRVGFENRVDLVAGRHLLALQDASARLTDHPVGQCAVSRDRPLNRRDGHPGRDVPARSRCSLDDGPRVGDHLLGHADQGAIGGHLLRVSRFRRHPFDFVHPAPRRARAIGERPDARRQPVVQVTHQAGQDAHRIPEQPVVGRVMNVRLDHGGVDPQLRPVLQAERDRRVDDRVIDRLQRVRGEPVEGAVERVVLRDPLALELGERPQRVAIGDPFPQFPVVPVLHAHQNQRAQDLRRGDAVPARGGLLQPSRQIALHGVDEGCVRVEERGDRLQGRFELNALLEEHEIGEAHLGIGRAAHFVAAR